MYMENKISLELLLLNDLYNTGVIDKEIYAQAVQKILDKENNKHVA